MNSEGQHRYNVPQKRGLKQAMPSLFTNVANGPIGLLLLPGCRMVQTSCRLVFLAALLLPQLAGGVQLMIGIG